MPGVTSETTSAEYNAAQELENLARVFAKLDKKGDGKVTRHTPKQASLGGPNVPLLPQALDQALRATVTGGL